MNKHVTTLQIDLNAVHFNLDYFKAKLSIGTKIMVVVKAFGYGSDAISIAKTIQDKVDYFAVAYTHEGVALRAVGIKSPILVLHPQEVNLETLVANKLEPNLYSGFILSKFLEVAATLNLVRYPIHIKFNTGLNRLGFWENDLDYLKEHLLDNDSVKITSIFSHLAASEDVDEREFTLDQIKNFHKISREFEDKFGFLPEKHLCNTSGILNYPEAHLDMVRLGIGMFGFANDQKETAKLKNVVSLKSVISQIHLIEKGESVGYNRSFYAHNPMKTATIAIGHADGISRHLGNGKGFVTINNMEAIIVGNVCMDMLMVDVTDIDCKSGDPVIIFDNQQMVELLAKQSGTISYELLTAISQRVRRQII